MNEFRNIDEDLIKEDLLREKIGQQVYKQSKSISAEFARSVGVSEEAVKQSLGL